jgi:uncharacterized protein
VVRNSSEHLLINTAELPDGTSELQFECSPESLGLTGLAIRMKDDVLCEFGLTKSGERVDIEGEVSFAYALDCSRCLSEYEVAGKERVKLYCRRSEANREGREVELSAQDVAAYFYKDNVIDLTSAVRDAVLLSVPMKPLCSAQCKGLCPVCGEDLNHTECSCSVHVADARWDALRKLKSNAGRD